MVYRVGQKIRGIDGWQHKISNQMQYPWNRRITGQYSQVGTQA